MPWNSILRFSDNCLGSTADNSPNVLSSKYNRSRDSSNANLYQARVTAPYNLSSTVTRGRDGAAGTKTDGGVGSGGRRGGAVRAVSSGASGGCAPSAAWAVAGEDGEDDARSRRGAGSRRANGAALAWVVPGRGPRTAGR